MYILFAWPLSICALTLLHRIVHVYTDVRRRFLEGS